MHPDTAAQSASALADRSVTCSGDSSQAANGGNSVPAPAAARHSSAILQLHPPKKMHDGARCVVVKSNRVEDRSQETDLPVQSSRLPSKMISYNDTHAGSGRSKVTGVGSPTPGVGHTT